MKSNCEGCGGPLWSESVAYVCSHECTFCPSCFLKHQNCPHCGGELVRRARGNAVITSMEDYASDVLTDIRRPWLIWVVSFAVWGFLSLVAALTIWQLYRSTDTAMRFTTTLWLQLSQILTYAPLTPLVFTLAIRHPLRRDNWRRLAPLYLAGGVAFCIMHVALRALTPYAVWDQKHHEWGSALWDSHSHGMKIQWPTLKSLFFYNLVDDITGTFVPIVLIAHAIAYYRKFREREIRAAQLEGQLAKSHLQSLKSQLQPHFLFNTMHSISALMLTDVQAADRMITRLGDLLRMNLEAAGIQITTLSRELDFVNCYLAIEKIRFEERLNICLDIAPETLDAQVPLLLLQPLVDNAVKHGISRLREGGEIRISASLRNDNLRLEVRDNGPGFECPEIGQEGGLGLRVTRERLATLYGQDQSVELTRPPEGGVAVVVHIPFRASAGKIDTPLAELVWERAG